MFTWKVGENPNGLSAIGEYFSDEAKTDKRPVEKITALSADLDGVAITSNAEIGALLDGADPVIDVTVPDFAVISHGDQCNITLEVDARFGDDVKPITLIGTIVFTTQAEASFGTLEFKPKP
ncbi:hypothetical protein M0R72_08085 [Candidatus Pacearchaeota archaeon]|nr:hypothetical protein [Candidatus Pacearchaeota archaeon]